MNFFGHALTASWVSDDPRFGLGAMLPDFASMVRARLVGTADSVCADGVAWHHLTDAVFHRHAIFREHSNALTSELAALGIGRGGSLAAGHVGVELLLDGLILDTSEAAGSLYLEALTHEAELGIEMENRSGEKPAADRLAELRKLLADRGLPIGYRDPAIVADRVIRVLQRRPRLAIAREFESALTTALAEKKRALSPDVSTLVTELRQTLVSNSGGDGVAESPAAPSST